ncbi:glycosyltransferase [Sphingobacterium sp. lm-10]|uniref:glycosyltransferase n=1 Tax=Sphingobacterium sp. lm-10 TaxID=2944904 RepID=UPI0020201140|nr:glycosyltransferase [Sphingobacterium sp. lm-10]MCL7988653.1 glycosyltransferase [Sphingobacterium sp. lm-10]
MKILRIISSMNPASGGPSQGIRNAVPQLKSLGVENEVLCFDQKDAEYGLDDNFIIHKIGPAKGPYAYVPELSAWLEANINRFDKVIIHGLWLYNSYGTYKIWNRLKKNRRQGFPSLYVMPHGMLDPYFQRAPERKWKALRNLFFWHTIERQVVNNVDGVLFTCERELELARETFRSYHPKAELNVSYGVQPPPALNYNMTDAFLKASGMLLNEPYLLFLSRIHAKKGVDILIEAYKSVTADGIQLPKLVIAGPLDSDYTQQLKQIAHEREDIVFTGMLRGDAKWGAIYGCELFILPSHQENFGIAVVEAMSCQKPVFITKQVNIYTVIEDNKAGVVFEDNLLAVTNALRELSSAITTADLKQLGANARRTYEEHYLPEGAAQKFIKAICQN